MQQDNLFSIFTGPLSGSGLKYFIGGSVASIVYGEPRLTHDIDLILFLDKSDANLLIDLFVEDDFYMPPVDVIKNEINLGERGHINILHHNTGFKADIYFVGKDPLQLWALQNINEIEFMNSKLPVAPIEYIIIKKLIYFREGNSYKHLDDIKGMLRESSETIDRNTLKDFLSKYELTDIFNQHFALD